MKPRTKMPNKKVPRRPPPKERLDNPNSLLYHPQFEKLVGEDCLITLKCSICLDFYNDPTVLPCGHTFCSKCLMSMAAHVRLNQRALEPSEQYIGCPECREAVYISNLANRETTLNYPIQQIIESMMRKENGHGGQIISKPEMVDASTSYDKADFEQALQVEETREREQVIQAFNKEMDGFERALSGSSSILNDAFLDIERIRVDHLDRLRKDEEAAAKARAEKKYGGKTQDVTDLPPMITAPAAMLDPAIVSYSMRHHRPPPLFHDFIRRPAVPVYL
ncbi:postreplication repair E3 ubiquitin-protein ligase RAD18-like [Haliotis rufescens]|uniref:postreplication repair E3 ubiquitin-protein ligase RAD18-like n=1 Tax=Haliotis rufescens TaxID=6454 RepID=UPI001EAFEDFC|nr:postreplication repair E3 ubiquitin-protein ligase RAD18-like [Haliotis rufescens]